MASKFITSVTSAFKSEQNNIYSYPEKGIKFSAARILLTGLVKNQYYASQKESIKEAVSVFGTLSKIDPEFLLKAICFARNSNMKGMVLIAIANLYVNASTEFLDNNREKLASTLKSFNPNNLNDFMEFFKSKVFGKGLGARVQKAINFVICSKTPKELSMLTLKYPSALRNLVINCHPALTDEQSVSIHYLFGKNKNKPSYGEAHTPEQLVVKEIMSLDFEKDASKVASLIMEYNIPFDCIKSKKGFNTGLVGAAVTSTMSLTALLLNIGSLSSVYSTDLGRNLLSTRLKEVRKGRFIPIDYVKPYLHTSDAKIKEIILNELVERLDLDFDLLKNLDIGVSIDCSGSMSGEPLITAGLLAFPFIKSNKPWVSKFDTSVHQMNISGNSLKDLKTLFSISPMGGTNVAAPIMAAISSNKSLDLMIIITDEQQNFGTPLMSAWGQYKKNINSNAELWIINASNYKWHSTNFDDPSITVYHTMSPQIFHNVQYFRQDLVQLIQNS
jgi:60 kDa SS-A/Ro ribonucleoprotein